MPIGLDNGAKMIAFFGCELKLTVDASLFSMGLGTLATSNQVQKSQ
jgi:hypothetical protein